MVRYIEMGFAKKGIYKVIIVGIRLIEVNQTICVRNLLESVKFKSV